MRKYFFAKNAKFVAFSTVMGLGVLGFQNCSQFEAAAPVGAANSTTQLASSSLGAIFQVASTSGGAARCSFNGDPSGWPSVQRGPTTEVLGTIHILYRSTDGTASGTCDYDLGVVGSVNPGTGFNISGKCTDPTGKQFPSKGTFWPVFGSPSPATSFNMLAGIGDCGLGDEISLQGVLNLTTSQVSNVTITETTISSNSSSVAPLATGSGSYTGKNPFAAYSGWSTTQSIVLPEGSTCSAVANPWGASEVIVARCNALDGRSFSLSGKGYPRGALASGTGFDFEGVAQDGMTYDHFYKTGINTWIGAWLNKQPVGYNLNYYDSANAFLGSCALGSPNSSGDISGTCVLKNTAFSISGNIGTLGSDGLYRVSLAGVVNGVSFSATVVFNASTGMSVAQGSVWTSSDGGQGHVTATAVR